MGKHIGSEINSDLVAKLDRGQLYRSGTLALPVLTQDPAGWPHVAIAPGAVSVRPDRVMVALGNRTQSLANLERDPRVTLLLAAPNTLYYLKGQARVIRREMQSLPQEAAFRVDLTEVIEDMESFLTITGGLTYRYNLMNDDVVTLLGAMLDELTELAKED